VSWTAIAVLALGAYAWKVLGLVVLGGRRPGPRAAALATLLPAALFAALIVVMTVAVDAALVLDARIVGVAAGAVAAWRRAPSRRARLP
jgi:branched-subunit amino acid transport protein AzlD